MGFRYEFSARGACVALAVGLSASVGYLWVMETAPGFALYLLVGAFGTGLSVVGAARMPPARRRIWWAFAFGQASFLLGDACWTYYEYFRDTTPPYPSVADVGYLATYPAFALGLLWMIRGRRRGRDRAAFLDAMILASGLTVVGIVFLVAPATEGSTGLLGQAVAASYPAGDLLVLALSLRMLTGGMARNASAWFLLAGLALLLAADLFYVSGVVTGVPYPPWVDAGYLVSYVLMGVAAVHPAAAALSEPAPDRPVRISGARIAWLGLALVLAPVTGQLARLMGDHSGGWVALFGGFVVAGLVVARLLGLLRELQGKAVQLAALARRDGLTGVPNRRTWDHELSRACALAREEGLPLSVAILDLDHFKAYNDQHGHLAGDRVLKATSAAWDATLPEEGLLARFGGEEFAVLLPHLDPADAGRVLERLRTTVTHGQTCSIGLATWDGSEEPADLVARADQALYHAKTQGRDRVAVHDGDRMTIVTRPTVQHPVLGTIRTVYQPIVDIRSGDVVAYEALSRFDGANPSEVFERAAQEGMGAAAEALAIRTALEAWDGETHLALNVSPSALTSDEVRKVLPADLLGVIFEITEAELVDYSHALAVTLEDLRARRALIAIDDFGIGFSNVHRILAVQPEIIKLDMSLIRGIDRDEMRQAVVTACLVFTRQTGSRVVAEGIETDAERECLARHGVQLGQGYLLGRPVTRTASS